MFYELAALFFLFGALQGTATPTVHRIFVTTPHNASVVFEYANAVMPEGQPLTPGKAECLTSELVATGLFSNAQIILKPVNKGDEVDIDILPTWVEFRDKVLVKEILMEGLSVIDEEPLKEGLRRRGLRVGMPVLRYPLPAIRTMILDSARELHHRDSKSINDLEETVSDLSFRIELIAPRAVRIRIIVGKNPLCE